jgi:hypothetical protein
MLDRAEHRVLSALSSLSGHPDFEVICDWLGKSLVNIRASTDTTKDEVMVRWQQGASQVLAELLTKKTEARETLYKLK